MATKSILKWQKGLTAAEWKHLAETCGEDCRPTLRALKNNLEVQRRMEFNCWICRSIARKLGLMHLLGEKDN